MTAHDIALACAVMMLAASSFALGLHWGARRR
jgi:hypothetical protein